MPLHYDFCARTDRGRVRSDNEDAVHVDAASRLAVLADGMGGYNAGEVASSMATTLIGQELGRWLAQAGGRAGARDARRAMEICVAQANRAIFRAATEHAHYDGMGTTLVMAAFVADRIVLGHIGDSRCYRWRARRLEQLTRDHSLLQEQLDAGLITPSQASTSQHRNLVTRALGVEEVVALELSDHAVEPGDAYLLCSDGLSDMLDDAAIGRTLGQGLELEACAQALLEQANAAGGHDNISVLLVRADGQPGRGSLITRWLRTAGADS